jgi:hypothetical protein
MKGWLREGWGLLLFAFGFYFGLWRVFWALAFALAFLVWEDFGGEGLKGKELLKGNC